MPLSPSNILRSTRKPTTPAKSVLKLELVTGYPYSGFDGISNLWARTNGVISIYPSPYTDPIILNARWFNEDTDGLAADSHGEFAPILNSNTSSVSVGTYGGFIEGDIIADGVSQLATATFGDISIGQNRSNWIKWSNIGSLDFTIWKDNIAGERPLDWPGTVYALKQLGSKVVAYGTNGVSFLVPAANAYGLETIRTVGIKSKQAVAGNKNVHFFIDTVGQLWSLSDELQLLDYSEYLSSLGSPVLSWDTKNQMLYICDGTTGYVYSPKDKSMGKGPPNVTGMAYQGGTLYPVAPATITTPVFSQVTDIIDMGTHKFKTIFEVEIGTNISSIGTLQVAIDYRSDYSAAFSSTSWASVPVKGSVLITALGREFRIKTKLLAYEYIEIDYMKIHGLVHDH